jgi:hypothetical protein
MAVSNPETVITPRWPSEPIDPEVALVDYDVRADEFLVYFGGKPVPAVSDPLDGPGFEDVAIMVGLGPDDEETAEIVGVQVIPMMLGAIPDQPRWSALTWAALAGEYGTELMKERLPIFLDQIAEAFRKYWTPAPPIDEQLARIARDAHKRQSA